MIGLGLDSLSHEMNSQNAPKAAFLGYILLIALFEITTKKDEDYNHLILQLTYRFYGVLSHLTVCMSIRPFVLPHHRHTNVK